MSNADVKDTEERTLDEMFEELDGLVENMQKNSLSLEETFAGYRKGLELVEQCSSKIEKIECDIKVINGEGE